MRQYKPLIYNSDIKALEIKIKTQNLNAAELEILGHKGLIEHKIQFAAKSLFNELDKELRLKGLGAVLFFQIDNGNNGATAGAKIRKWQAGTVAKMPDVGILVFSKKRGTAKTIFCEFKKVDTEAGVKGSAESPSALRKKLHFEGQLAMQERLRGMGFSVHLTNNTVYCKQVILKEIMDFIN